ncbi:UNVERIFIED_CONTAM: Histone-lysine N-methyltransferase SETMAR [Trichonephila clavipes]
MNSKKEATHRLHVKILCAVFGKDIVNVRTCESWFSKFHSGDLSLQESVRSGRPSKIYNDVLRSMLENYSHLTSQEIAEEFGIHHTTVGDHIKSHGFVLKQSVWVPHELTEKDLSDRVGMCLSHLIRHNVEPFSDKLTGDEKWIPYENIKRKNLTSNLEHHQQQFQKKVSINEKYCFVCSGTGKVHYQKKKKRPELASRKGIVFHHDNARSHTAMEILGHPPYSPDIALSDYYLFRSLQNYLTEKKFKSFESVSKAVADYFNSKDENFYKMGIYMLPERWQQVVTNNGAYIID